MSWYARRRFMEGCRDAVSAADSKNGRDGSYCSVVVFFLAYVCVAYP
jgi:hypothetical protein